MVVQLHKVMNELHSVSRDMKIYRHVAEARLIAPRLDIPYSTARAEIDFYVNKINHHNFDTNKSREPEIMELGKAVERLKLESPDSKRNKEADRMLRAITTIDTSLPEVENTLDHIQALKDVGRKTPIKIETGLKRIIYHGKVILHEIE